jgi:hypothetical protein
VVLGEHMCGFELGALATRGDEEVACELIRGTFVLLYTVEGHDFLHDVFGDLTHSGFGGDVVHVGCVSFRACVCRVATPTMDKEMYRRLVQRGRVDCVYNDEGVKSYIVMEEKKRIPPALGGGKAERSAALRLYTVI